MKVIVHEFEMAGVDDPDMYAAEPLYNWEKSPEGQWVIEHSLHKPIWYRHYCYPSLCWKYIVEAEFEGIALTEWFLKKPKKHKQSS